MSIDAVDAATRFDHIRTSGGKSLQVNRKLTQGGEGAICDVGIPGKVAKIYHQPTKTKKNKLRALIDMRDDSFDSFAAWPETLLFQRGRFVGFLMPRVHGFDVHKLYSPKSRKIAFPRADYRFLVRVAANISRAVAALHEHDCVIGDINHGSIFVSRNATVKLLDCDSFQISHRGEVFTCDVGVPLFTPPEIQGKGFRSIVRTANHDCFGLAVLIFHLLMMGRHPFSGRYSGQGEMPIERAIRESRYAFARFPHEMAPPNGMSYRMLAPSVAQLFERAFKVNPWRPSAAEWVECLDRAETSLVECEDDPQHYHQRGQSCPWCSYEVTTGASLFGGEVSIEKFLKNHQPRRRIDIEKVMENIDAVDPPAVPESTFYMPPLEAKEEVSIKSTKEWRQMNRWKNISVVAVIFTSSLLLLSFYFRQNFIDIFLAIIVPIVIVVLFKYNKITLLSDLNVKRSRYRSRHISAKQAFNRSFSNAQIAFLATRDQINHAASQLKALYRRSIRGFVAEYIDKKKRGSRKPLRITRKLVAEAEKAMAEEEKVLEAKLLAGADRLREITKRNIEQREVLRREADRTFHLWQRIEDIYHSVRLNITS